MVGEVDFAVVNNVQDIINQLESGVLPDLASRHGVEWSFEGQQADQRQTIDDMLVGLVIALVLIYIILTWVFASWSIPLVIMLTMPLGVIGAIVGHWLMGKEMSILSFSGVFALMGIIVNDSIVLGAVLPAFAQGGAGRASRPSYCGRGVQAPAGGFGDLPDDDWRTAAFDV